MWGIIEESVRNGWLAFPVFMAGFLLAFWPRLAPLVSRSGVALAVIAFAIVVAYFAGPYLMGLAFGGCSTATGRAAVHVWVYAGMVLCGALPFMAGVLTHRLWSISPWAAAGAAPLLAVGACVAFYVGTFAFAMTAGYGCLAPA